MGRTLLVGKTHRAPVTRADLPAAAERPGAAVRNQG